MFLGQGKYRYEWDQGWAGEAIKQMRIGVVAGITVDSEDNVYVLVRSDPPVIVLDKSGKVTETFGTGLFGRPHGMFRDRDGSLFGVDDHDHIVMKFNGHRKVVMTLGTRGRASDTGYTPDHHTVERAAGPFNRPTRLVTDPAGNIYVTDGYGNARVHKFDASGRLIKSWGTPGSAPGQFNLPHGIGIDSRGRLYVADRGNDRVQLFTTDGEFIEQWTDFNRPSDIWIDKDDIIYVSENRRASKFSGVPSRVTILDAEGRLLSRLGDETVSYDEDRPFFSAHGIAVDSEGSIYIGNVGQHWLTGTTGLYKYKRILS